MELVKILIWLINLIGDYAVFDIEEFEFFEVDQRPEFYLGVFTLRPKKD